MEKPSKISKGCQRRASASGNLGKPWKYVAIDSCGSRGHGQITKNEMHCFKICDSELKQETGFMNFFVLGFQPVKEKTARELLLELNRK